MAPRIAVFTLFPALLEEFRRTSLLGRAVERGLLGVEVHDLRSHGAGVHRAVDDTPFGGGAGMVLTPGPVFDCVEATDAPRPVFVLLRGATPPLDFSSPEPSRLLRRCPAANIA